jgi:hypothetical protein
MGNMYVGGSHPRDDDASNIRNKSWGWAYFLLPQLEANNLFEKLDTNHPPYTPDRNDDFYDAYGPPSNTVNKEPCENMPAVLVCPSATRKGSPTSFKDYAINLGSNAACCGERTNNYDTFNGIAFMNSKINFKDITDGLSTTLMFMEQRHWPWIYQASKPASFDRPTNHFLYVSHNSEGYAHTNTAPNATLSSFGRFSRSDHPGGIQVTLCDGAVRFITDNINLSTFRAISTRKNRDVADGF